MSEEGVVEARVATVLTDYKVALNVGKASGVEVGDAVVLWNVVTVTDPDTAEELGTVRLEKMRMELVEIHDKFCIAEVLRGSDSALGAMFATRRRIRATGTKSEGVPVARGEIASIYIDS